MVQAFLTNDSLQISFLHILARSVSDRCILVEMSCLLDVSLHSALINISLTNEVKSTTWLEEAPPLNLMVLYHSRYSKWME